MKDYRPSTLCPMRPFTLLSSLLLASFLVALFPGGKADAADAAPPSRMTFQSYLTDSNGDVVGANGAVNRKMVFTIYNQESAGSVKWVEEQIVTVNNGHFSVILGEGSPKDEHLDKHDLQKAFSGPDASDRFIELTLSDANGANEQTLSPRLRLLPAPYAFMATRASALMDDNGNDLVTAVSSDEIRVQGTINATTKLSTPTVSATTINADNAVLTSKLSADEVSGKKVSTETLDATTVDAETVDAETVNATTVNATNGNGIIPLGGIIMWSGSHTAVPAGWALCNGTTVLGRKTPDLQDRFVVGAGSTYSSGNTGGANSVTLTTSQIPAHSHSGSTNTDGAHTHKGNGRKVADNDDNDSPAWYIRDAALYPNETNGTIGSNGSAHRHSFTTNNTGGGGSHENRPPYFALAFIMRVQ